MAKRRTKGLNTARYNTGENPIDIDGAFAPTKGQQSVDYDVDDESIGLTQAFGAVVVEDEPKYGWNDTNKWTNFDWNASFGEEDETSGANANVESDGAPAGDEADAEATEPETQAEGEAAASAHAATSTAASASSGKTSSARGRHAAPTVEDSPRMRKSRRMRKTLVALIILAIIGLAALGYFGYRAITEGNQQATQQTQEQAAAKDDRSATAAADVTTTATRQADVPDLSGVLGMTQDEAVGAIKRGALVSSTRENNEEGSAIKTNVTVSLTSEPADSRTGGTPTVYLGLNAEGRVIQAGYSASASALGFGSLSFADAVNNEHVIEKTLAKVGVDVAEGTVKLPENKDEYSTYASDGTTVEKERCSFEGATTVNNTPCTWSAVLSYDYTRQVFTGNLSDTIRVIYVYVTAN